MANRSFHKPLGSLEVDMVSLYVKAAIGASGAVTLDTTASKGISTMVRDSAGKYTITLSDAYNAFRWADVVVLDDTNSDPVTVGIVGRLYSQDVSASTPVVVIQFYNFTNGSAADPANGATVYVKIECRNSSVS